MVIGLGGVKYRGGVLWNAYSDKLNVVCPVRDGLQIWVWGGGGKCTPVMTPLNLHLMMAVESCIILYLSMVNRRRILFTQYRFMIHANFSIIMKKWTVLKLLQNFKFLQSKKFVQ